MEECYVDGCVESLVFGISKETGKMETVLSLSLGIGLSAACGFRVFVPLLVMSIAAKAGHLILAPGYEWVATYPALIALAAATFLEIAGYYIPWVDNALDTVATPASIIAGIVVMASIVTGMSPFLKWTLAVIMGGGAAGLTQIATTVTRVTSTTVTAGLGNFIISTVETFVSFTLSILAIGVPILGAIAVVAILSYIARKYISGSAEGSAP